MRRNVVALFGINASGKTAVGTRLAASVPGAEFVQSSSLLMARLGGDRAALEAMSAEIKERTLRAALIESFEAHADAPLVFADMHLVVTIRKDGVVRREHLWSQEYAQYLRAAFFLWAPPEVILARRERDAAETGRVRDMNLSHVAADLETNLAEFRRSVAPAVPIAEVIENTTSMEAAAASILAIARSKMSHMRHFGT